jgi:hypothetical protein
MTRLATVSSAAILAVVAAIVAAPAISTLVAPTEVQCGEREYVVGLNGRTGLWIDATGPICARWDDRTFQPILGRPKRPVGGPGGRSNQQSCPAGSAINGWRVESIIEGDAAFADGVSAQCQTLAPPHDVTAAAVRFGGQNTLRRAGGRPKVGRCPEGELATGISVWTSLDGRFVTDVSMRCGRAPSVFSGMARQNGPNGTVTYFSPELKVRSGDTVQLDWCREWATNCGAPAAEAFCVSKGWARAVDFAAKPNVGLTVIISDKRICNVPGCTGFATIACGPAQ